MNSARSANWMLNHLGLPGCISYFGGSGNDADAERLENNLLENGITARFHKDANTRTGSCAVLVLDNERALLANLGATQKYIPEHMDLNMDIMLKAECFYTTGFFVLSNCEAMMKMMKLACEREKIVCFNLSAVFLIE